MAAAQERSKARRRPSSWMQRRRVPSSSHAARHSGSSPQLLGAKGGGRGRWWVWRRRYHLLIGSQLPGGRSLWSRHWWWLRVAGDWVLWVETMPEETVFSLNVEWAVVRAGPGSCGSFFKTVGWIGPLSRGGPRVYLWTMAYCTGRNDSAHVKASKRPCSSHELQGLRSSDAVHHRRQQMKG